MRGSAETNLIRQDSTAPSLLPYYIFALFGALAIVSIAYFDTYRSMIAIYLQSDTFLHGFIILPICLYLVWRKWPQLASILPQTYVPGLFLLLGFSTIWFVADLLGIQVGKHFAVTAMIPAAVLTILGVSFARAIAFPLAYLFFAVPFGEFWVPELQEITADFAVGLLRLTGIPVFRDGLFLIIPAGNFEVAEACSGIRYLLASMALGTLYAYLSFTKTYKRLVFIAFSIALPIVANGVRAYGIIAIAYYSDMKYAIGVDHLIYGWIFFGVVIGLMFLVGGRFRDGNPPDHELVVANIRGARSVRPPSVQIFVLLATAAATTPAPLASHALATEKAQETALLNGLPDIVAGWQGAVTLEPEWLPSLVGTPQEFFGRYWNVEAQVDVALIRYVGQRQGSELASRSNSFIGANEWRLLDTRTATIELRDGEAIQVLKAIAVKHGLVRHFLYWYEVDGDVVLSSFRTKLREAYSLLKGRPGISSVIVVSVIEQERSPEILQAFLGDSYGAIRKCLGTALPQANCSLGRAYTESD